MAERIIMTVPRRPNPGRAVLRVFKSLLAIACAIAAVWLAIIVAITPACPEHAKKYTVTPAEVHGTLEYCLAEAEFITWGREGEIRRPKVHSDALCGQDKAALVARAEAMTSANVRAQAACETRAINEPYKVFIEPIIGRFSR